jgi:quinol monooxygenase YgiN
MSPVDGDAQPVTRLLPGRVGLFIRLQGRQGSRPGVLDALHTYVDRLDEEPGTEGFVVGLDPAEPDVVWLYEWFRDEQALEDHRQAPAFAELIASMPELVDGPAGMLRVDPLRLHLSGGVLAGPGPDLDPFDGTA